MKRCSLYVRLLIVTLAIVVAVFFTKTFVVFPLSPTSLGLADVVIGETDVRFSIINGNSGCYLMKYRYKINEQGVLEVRFWGTMFECFSLKDHEILVGNVSNVNQVLLVDRFS